MSQVALDPRVTVHVDGHSLDETDLRGLVSVRVRERLSAPAQCELTFHEPGSLAHGDLSIVGRELIVRLNDQEDPLFVGSVTALETQCGSLGEYVVRVRGYDACHELQRRQTPRAHLRASAKTLAADLTADLDLTVEDHLDGPVHRTILQHSQSDLGLLAETCTAAGGYFTLRGRKLHLVSLLGFGTATTLHWGTSLLEASFENNSCRSLGTLHTAAWDVQRATGVRGRQGRPVAGQACAVDTETPRSLSGWPAEGEAHLEARALGVAAAACHRWFEGVAEGRADLRPGARVVVQGAPSSFCGEYSLTSTEHVIDSDRGYVTRISTVPPTTPRTPQLPVATLGVVSQVGDPNELGRVRATLPAFFGIETDWLAVTVPAAGKDKGLIALPDVGDRVLVLLVGESLADGVVLGGLYGDSPPPDAGVQEGRTRRFTFRTPGGQRVVLDDGGEGSVRIENESGSRFELGAKKCLVHSEVDMEIRAPGKRVTISAHSIDFEQS